MFIHKCVKLVLNGGGLNINARHTFQTFVKENKDKFDFPSTSQCDCVGTRHKNTPEHTEVCGWNRTECEKKVQAIQRLLPRTNENQPSYDHQPGRRQLHSFIVEVKTLEKLGRKEKKPLLCVVRMIRCFFTFKSNAKVMITPSHLNFTSQKSHKVTVTSLY